MALLAIFKGKGFTKDMYEALRPEVKWETNVAPGTISHACAFDAAGDILVVDLWESEEQMNAFVGTRLVPAFQKLGIPMPEVTVLPAHEINVFPGASQYATK